MGDDQVRIMLWTVPRSLSTAFFRAMMNHSKSKVFNEPYGRAYYHGKEKQGSTGRYDGMPLKDKATYQDVKESLEQDFPDADVVFAKECSYFLADRTNNDDYLPKNFVHTFLIRQPKKSIPSFYKGCIVYNQDNLFQPEGASYKEIYELFKLATEDLGQDAIVVDADDLQRSPEAVLRLYCHKVGITYEESMIKWKHPIKDLSVFGDWNLCWFKTCIETSTFLSQQPTENGQKYEVPPEVERLIQDNNEYYNKMYKYRLKVE